MKAKVLGITTATMVDTGADGGGISSAMVDADPRLLKYVHRRKPRVCVAVDKTPLRSPMSLLLPIELGGKLYHHEFHVISNLINPLLIGLDFLSKHGVRLNFSTNTMQIGDGTPIPIGPAVWHPPTPTHLATMEEVSIPPESLMLVNTAVGGLDPRLVKRDSPPKVMTIRPLMGDRDMELPCIAAWGLIDLKQDTHWIEMLNPTKQTIVLPAGTPVAMQENLDPEIAEDKEPPDKVDPQSTSTSAGTNEIPKAFATVETPKDPPAPQECEESRGSCGGGTLPAAGRAPPILVDLDGQDDSLSEEASKFSSSMKGSLLDKDKEGMGRFSGMCEDYNRIFARHGFDLGKTALAHHYISLTTTKPVHAPFYKAPPPEVRREIDQQTDELIAMGVARESNSPYSAPIVLVRKKDGSWRYCTDFRRLNKVTEKASFPLPNIHDSLRRFHKPAVISTMDLIKGYHQIEVAPAHRKYFGFCDGRRHMEYIRTPMGAKNSGATMAALMELVFRGLPSEYILSYLDDIVVATPDIETHFVVLEQVFKALAAAGLKVHPGKCQFFRSKVSVLGFVISADGIAPDPRNLEKVREWPTPESETDVRSFVGLANYYRCHIPRFAKIAEPLTDLLAKDRPFQWEQPQQEAFDKLKQLLLEGTACAFPDFEKEFILKTDASDTTVGAVLSQRDERNHDLMVACASQKLNAGEKRWCTYDKEFWGVVWGVRQFAHYLRYRRFILYTDHQPLLSCQSVDTSKDANGKRTRWSLELASYDIDIRHKKGKANSDADALSRAPHADEAEPQESQEEIVFLGAMSTTEAPVAEILAQDDKGLTERLVEGQQRDPDIVLAKKWITDSLVEGESLRGLNPWYQKNRDCLTIHDGILYHWRPNRLNEREARVVVPYCLIEEVLHRVHGDAFAGHPGEKRSYDRVSRFCIWPTMRADINEKVRSCPECQQFRKERKFSKAVRVLPQRAKFPLHYVQADLLELPIVSKGCDHILVIEDRYTKYACFYPMGGKHATTVAKHFFEFVRRFGCPVVWGTDNGGEFKNRLIESLCKVYGTRKEFSLEYHPQTQGQTERKNSTIIAELCRRVAQWGPQWVNYIPSLELGYNTTPHTSDRLSPHLKMFGREARTPLQNALPQPADTKHWSKGMANHVREHQKQLEKIHQVKEELHQQYRDKMAQPPRGKDVKEPYQVGDQVMRSLPRNEHAKLAPKFDGPWEVKKRIDPAGDTGNTYVLTRGDEEIMRPQVDLKCYHTPVFERPPQSVQPIEAGPSLQEQSKLDDLSKSMEFVLSVSNLIGGSRRMTRSATARMAANESATPVTAEAVAVEIPVAPGVGAEGRAASEVESGPASSSRASEVARDQVADLLVGPSRGKPSHEDPDRTLANSSSDDGSFHDVPPIGSSTSRLHGYTGLEDTPTPRLTGALASTSANDSPSDVFRLTGFTPTNPWVVSDGSIQEAGPTSSTPKKQPTDPASAPEQGPRAYRPTRYASAPDAAGPSSSAELREAGPPSSEQDSPAVVVSKQTMQELKKLMSFNKPGLAEESLDQLPPRSKRK